MKKAMLGVVAIGLLMAADDKKDDVKDKLKGTWTIVSMEAGGVKVPAEAFKDSTISFDGEKMTHEQKGKKEPATYKLDTTKKPAELDMSPTEGDGKGKTIKMIIELDGDNLKLAMGKDPSAARPKGFDDKEAMIMTLKREKK
jgi:uncharacterized protein (TIGR03067 family)